MTIERATAELFDPTGVTSLGTLDNAHNIQWQDILSQQGTATAELPLADTVTAAIVDRCIVKFTLYGSVRFGCRLTSEIVQLAVDGRRWLRFESQPGLLQLLGDGVVLPELGLANTSAATRIFGFMSVDGPWRVTGDWQAPQGYPFASETIRVGVPPDLALPNPDWIGYVDPDTSRPDGTIDYLRREFTLVSVETLEFVFTADNFLDLYLDGEPLVAADLTNPLGFLNTTSVKAKLQPGDHVLAAKVTNAPNNGAGNPMGLIGVVYPLDSLGNRSGVYIQTDTTTWTCTSSTVAIPGWTRAQVLKKLVEEAQTAGAFGPSALTVGFTDTDDSDSNPWADAPDEYQLPIGTVNLADVATQLAESGIDVEVDAATMTLNAWARKGSDLSGSIALTLGPDGGNLKSYETTKTVARFTDVIAQLADGSWQETTDSGAVTAVGGHVFVALSLGSTSETDTATNIALAQLAQSAQPMISATAQPSCLDGDQVYIDYDMGDTITVPAHRNDGTMKARVLGITVDSSVDVLDVWPQLVLDGSV